MQLETVSTEKLVPTVSCDAARLFELQEMFFRRFFEQQREFTIVLLDRNKILTQSVKRLISLFEINQLNADLNMDSSTEGPSDDPDFVYKGLNLLSIPREQQASRFGRKLGRVIFGDKDECNLINAMMSPGKDQEKARRKCCDDKKTIFARVKKYLKSPEVAYAAAREAANQMGREFRGKYLSRITGAAKGSSPNYYSSELL